MPGKIKLNHKEAMTYKEAMTEIETIVAMIEDNRLDVDELSEKVKRVALLITFCKSKLHETEEEVEKILKSIDE
ncbi:MAG: exodeoxyribonuclease VII small subunit [Odoribacter sp.]